MYLILRTEVDAKSLAGPIRDAIWSVDGAQPVDAVQTVQSALYERNATAFALIALFVAFAVFALAMAGLGIYGVTSYAVSQRRVEIGLRMALGAEGTRVRWMVVQQGARRLLAGIGMGLAAAVVLSRILSNVVFGVSAYDPVTFLGVPAVLIGVAVLANLVPAHRATRLDPAGTLRGER
jgi:ABC-type antimicrobial peptide transport system permease subunit